MPRRSHWRGGRAGPSMLRGSGLRFSGGPAAGMAGVRGDDLTGAARPESKRSGATKRGAGQFVKRAREGDGGHVPVTAIREPAIPGHGKGRPRHPAGAAGLDAEAANGGVAVRARDGSPAGSRRCAFDIGSMRSTTARPRAAGTRPSRAAPQRQAGQRAKQTMSPPHVESRVAGAPRVLNGWRYAVS